ncbi:DUF502 domain-containing protein [Stratiformator vulcanicus]|uniref:DUF502 domain-containing protein n=1 Tax=Stratiformator vulcanicus TaxID=2527980 RepID=A0A517R4Z8_9PLAN|nr:DUF502 domain-containing protein [Stratiformator vulcanicus]QDT38951.1 hypothetical protein Pan189_33510 [Stratiformator vulcanicus]
MNQPPQDAPTPTTALQIFVKGLGISLPSILTLVILIWFGGVIYRYIIDPISWAVQYSIASVTSDARPADGLLDSPRLPQLKYTRAPYNATYRLTENRLASLKEVVDSKESIPVGLLEDDPRGVYIVYGNEAVPYEHYRDVARRTPAAEMPTNAPSLYERRVTFKFFGSSFLLSLLAVLFVLSGIFFVGRIVTVRLGAYLVERIERNVLGRLPLISKVYSSVKQVTDFFFSERTVEYNRVVAIEYPRKGIWSLGFVTGNSMRQLVEAAGEPIISVLIPTSPMPMTGYTMSLPRSHVVDLDISVDQAFQFIVSCGVLIPVGQAVTATTLADQVKAQIEEEPVEYPETGNGAARRDDEANSP